MKELRKLLKKDYYASYKNMPNQYYCYYIENYVKIIPYLSLDKKIDNDYYKIIWKLYYITDNLYSKEYLSCNKKYALSDTYFQQELLLLSNNFEININNIHIVLLSYIITNKDIFKENAI